MVGIVQARDDVGHAEQMVGHLRAHEVRVVQLGDGGQHIALFHAGTDEHVLVEAHALHGAAVEVAAEVREGIGVLVDAADVVAIVREHIGQLRPHAPAPDHNHVAHRLLVLLQKKMPCGIFSLI